MRIVTIILISLSLLGLVRSSEAQTATRVRGGYDVEIEHKLQVGVGANTLDMERYTGDVDLVWGDSRTVVVTEVVHIDARNEDDARQEAQRAFSVVEDVRSGIRIRSSRKFGEYKSIHIELAAGMRASVSTSNGDITAYSADAQVEVASGNGDISVVRSTSTVKARSGNGDIEISDVEGPVTGSSGSGDIIISDVNASIELGTGAGDITASRVRGRVKAQTGGGDVVVEDIGDSVELRTAGGDVEASDVSGSADLSTSGGSIEVAGIGGDLYATTLGGDIEGYNVRGAISAETMAGDMVFDNVTQELVATTEVGDIEVRVTDASFLKNGSLRLRTAHGEVDLYLPLDTNADVSIDLGFDGEYEPAQSPRQLRLREMVQDMRRGRVRRVKGILNRGGGLIEIESGSGDVSIRETR